MAVVTARSSTISIFLSLMLVLCILSTKKRAFVTSHVIRPSLKFVEDSPQESYVFSSLYAARVKGCSLSCPRNLVCMLLILSGDVEICPGPCVKESLKLKRRADLEHINLEGLWLEVLVKDSKSFLFGCFYRPRICLKNIMLLFLKTCGPLIWNKRKLFQCKLQG